MTPKEAVMEAQSREAFEKWATEQGLDVTFREDRGVYWDSDTHGAWLAWQARGPSDYARGVKDAATYHEQKAKELKETIDLLMKKHGFSANDCIAARFEHVQSAKHFRALIPADTGGKKDGE